MWSVIGAVIPSCSGSACVTFPRRGQCPQVTLSSSKTIGEADGKKENLSFLGIDFKLKLIQTLCSRNLTLAMFPWVSGYEHCGAGILWICGLAATGRPLVTQQELAAGSQCTQLWEQDLGYAFPEIPVIKLCVCVYISSIYTKSWGRKAIEKVCKRDRRSKQKEWQERK